MSDKIELYVNNVMVFQQVASGPAPTGPTAPTAPTGPIPPVGDGLDDFRARQRVSQNCAWVQVTPAESSLLLAALGPIKNTYTNFYTIGGSGGLGAFEAPDPNSPTGYSFQDFSDNHGGAVTYDVNQAADVCVQWFATQQGRTVPPPVNV